MIETVWAERIGMRGAIDCDFDSESRTVLAGDVDGSVVLLDASGNRLGQHQVELPVWGVAQRRDQSSHLIAVATADKERKQGRAYLFSDGEKKAVLDTDGELWDCAFTSEGPLFTCWNSTIYVMNKNGDVVDRVATPGVPYGLSVRGQEVAVALNEVGVGSLQSNGNGYDLSVSQRFPSVCYNLHRSEDSDLIVTGSKGDSAAILASLTQQRQVGGKDVCAVATDGEFLVAGSLDGKIALFHLGAFVEPLATLLLPGGIWNIALDGSSGLAYVACGDGNLYCLQLDLTKLSTSKITAIRSAVRSPLEEKQLHASASSAAAIEIASGMVEQEWDRWPESDLASIARATKEWLRTHESPRLYYLLGLAELERGESDEAILQFQRIPGDSEYALRSLLPLGRALQMNGSMGAAIRVLRMNLPRVPEDQRAEYLFEIGRLHEVHGDDENALDAFELVSALNHSYPGLRASLDRLRNRHSLEVEPQVELSSDFIEPPKSSASLSARRTSEYDSLSYLLYEYGSPDEEAKKHMETDLMARFLADKSVGRSLDVGCATGRWPEWFARKGYEAHGYDISPASIGICERRAEQHPELSLQFNRYNVTEGALLTEYFNVVTCMMGTFNHVAPDDRRGFLEGIRDSLASDGRFIASVWNASSPFCEFLGLDGQHARETLRRNSLEQEELLGLLRVAGFAIDHVTPFCFLPNDCYRVWEDEFRDGVAGMIGIENHLRANLISQTRSQMNFVVAKLGQGA